MSCTENEQAFIKQLLRSTSFWPPNQVSRKEPFMNSAGILCLRWGCRLMLLTAALLFATGCATNGRYVLLKEYSATGPAGQAELLRGKTICIQPFHCASSLTTPDPKTQPELPDGFKFVEFTVEQNKTWDKEFRALEKTTPKDDLREIGNLRNMFGMVMSHVYALNDPGAWLAETLKM